MLKLAGSLLVITASVGVAWSIRKELAEHLKLLYEIRRFLVALSGEAVCSMQPVEILIGCFVKPADERLQSVCGEIADKLMEKSNGSGEEVWRMAWEEHAKELGLRAEETEIIKNAGGAFFGKSVHENGRQLSLVLERLDFVIEEERGQQKDRLRVYQAVSVMCGLMVVILLL